MQRTPTRVLPALLAAWLLAAGALPARAQTLEPDEGFNKGGRTALQFLKIGIGARQAALGEAGIATVRDVNAVFWNAAGLTGIERFETSFSYVRWLGDLNYAAGAAGAHWRGVGVFALSVAALDYGDIPEALVSGGSGGDARTGNTFTGGDLLAGLSFARAFTDRLSIGLGVKLIRETLFDYAVNAYAFDVGSQYDLGYKGITLAMSIQNLAGAVQWLDRSDRTEGYDLPLLFRIGVSTNVVGGQDAIFNAGESHGLVASAEAINTNDYSERLHLGAEYSFSDFLMVRGGYRLNYAEGNWTAGFGLAPQVSGVALRLDYAYVAYRFLDAPHRLTLSLAF